MFFHTYVKFSLLRFIVLLFYFTLMKNNNFWKSMAGTNVGNFVRSALLNVKSCRNLTMIGNNTELQTKIMNCYYVLSYNLLHC